MKYFNLVTNNGPRKYNGFWVGKPFYEIPAFNIKFKDHLVYFSSLCNSANGIVLSASDDITEDDIGEITSHCGIQVIEISKEEYNSFVMIPYKELGPVYWTGKNLKKLDQINLQKRIIKSLKNCHKEASKLHDANLANDISALVAKYEIL